MPTRNAIKDYLPDAYYHIYSRGIDKRQIFIDEDDYAFFLSLFKRYLSPRPTTRPKHPPYRTFYGELDLLSFCLMPNHVHLFVRQNENERAIREFMGAMMTSYSRYFNQKYERFGPLFQSRYLASRITNDAYLMHISRYIHLNPKLWRDYPFSSIKYFQGKAAAEWINPAHVLELFGQDARRYLAFVADHEDYKNSLDLVDTQLANS